eukprot:TRINITY_DN9381_c0_g1_i1.p1 TRINITY_DN9381_c0_g1~~TRINITY_DN9381_c0_g1_i1.p1  ORF type:complete len:174 (+),score=50.14 TRINITY_DN9381_c0_g1_i1:38-523(+)
MTKYGLPISVESDLDKIAVAEEEGYPADEMASKEVLESRMKEASDYFLKAEEETGELVGFVCGTLSVGDKLEEEAMYSHNPTGTHLCIHSVVTLPQYQKKGHARANLLAYLSHVKKTNITKISLIAKEKLTGFYQSVGFTLMGKSPIVHGEDAWYDLVMVL